MVDKSINIPGYGKLEHESQNLDLLFRRASCFYGPSDTGKSTLMRHYMKKLQPYIPLIHVICPTAGANDCWDDVDSKCVIKVPTVDKLRLIFDRQVDATAVYNKANDMRTLQKLFARVNDHKALSDVKKYERLKELSLKRIQSCNDMNYAEKDGQSKDIKEKTNDKIKSVYKTTIKKYRNILIKKKDSLDQDEKYSLKFLNFNPSLLLILDDCAAMIKEWSKNTIINRLFFESRHYWVTSWYALHSDNMLLPAIRKNSFGNFFTDANVAMSFFNNKENNFTKDDKKKANVIASHVFQNSSSGVRNHKKMIYNRKDNEHKFRYIIASIPPKFKMGSPYLLEYCARVPKKENSEVVSKSSRFSNSFKV